MALGLIVAWQNVNIHGKLIDECLVVTSKRMLTKIIVWFGYLKKTQIEILWTEFLSFLHIGEV